MKSTLRPGKHLFGMVFLAFLVGSASPGVAQAMMSAQNAGPPPGVDGVILSLNGRNLVLKTSAGDSVKVLLDSGAFILGRQAATLASIRPGEALGVAATKAADGSLTATAINIFTPEQWKRVRRGQFPMASGQIMTNAELDRVADHVQGKTLYLKFEMLTAAIDVPDGVDIKRAVNKTLADLAVGMTVSLRGKTAPDGSFSASSLSFELTK